MAEDRVSSWVELQKKVWDCDNGLRAELITLETPSGDVVASWPVDLENLGAVIVQTIDLQASELPKGGHRFRLVAYSDKNRKNQLNELPQTIRGRSGDASQAQADAIALQRATAMAISNLENVTSLLSRLNEKLEAKLDERTEDFATTYNKLIEANADNFDQKIRWSEHEARTRRSEQLLEMCEPLIGMAIQKFGPMLLRMDPADVRHFLETPGRSAVPPPPPPAEPPPPPPPPAEPLPAEPTSPPPPASQGNHAGTTKEPPSSDVSSVHEPRQTGISPKRETRPAGSRRNSAASSSRKVKRATPTKGKRR